MELKTRVIADTGRQDLTITRKFDLPVDLLFTAFINPDLVSQWMGTKVIKLDSWQHGGYLFETTDLQGNIHRFHGTIHEIKPNQSIIRTFEMEGTPFPAQLEFLSFESVNERESKLVMHVIYKSGATRDNILKLPFQKGINMAHDRLEQLLLHSKQNEDEQ